MSDLRALGQRLGEIADRAGELGERPARRIAGLDWRCPRGRRALWQAELLGRAGRGVRASLSEAAHELTRAGEER
jgi:hypothetical protein